MDSFLLHSWAQAITILGGCLITVSFWRKEHREDIQKIDEKINKLDDKWEANIKALDDKWDANIKALDDKWDANWKHSDEKWERLFSLFVQKISSNSENT